MKTRIYNRVWVVYAIVLALGITLVSNIYDKGNMVLGSAMHLLDAKLPLVEQMFAVKSALSEQEIALHQYASTGKRNVFQSTFMLREEKFLATLARIGRAREYAPYIEPVSDNYRRFRELTDRFDELMQAEDLRGDARQLLNRITEVGLHIQDNLDQLAGAIVSDVHQGGRVTESGIESITSTVVIFCVILLTISGFVGYYVNAFLSEVEARRKLALFAESNPNPVLRLDSAGRVDWSNPAAARMVQAAGRASVRDLLPADLTERLHRMRDGDAPEHAQFEAGERTLDCTLHYLSEFGTFHAYVVDITERTRAERKLVHQAYHDALTELPNRYRFTEQLQQMLDVTADARQPAVLLINLSRFRTVIAGLGHAFGDRLLKLAAKRLRHALEECRENCINATLFRLESDNFGLIVSEAACQESAPCVARNIQAAFTAPFVIDNQELFVGVAIGYAACPQHGRDPVTLVRNADAALQKIKQDRGTGILGYSEELNARAIERLALERDLRYALERNELGLVYQPQAEIAGGGVIGCEALLRWHHPTRGLVSPAEFIPAAEETGLIIPIGEWVLHTACAQARSWHERGLPPFTIAVNISARQFIQPDFVPQVARIIDEHGIDARRIELEITESIAVQDIETTISRLTLLRNLGVKLAIDDFGTGYSSLGYLKRFPVDKLKIDQSFVRNLTRDLNDAAITRAVIQLGHSLNLSVIAEGVETGEHLERLNDYGCDEIQGYLLSKPLLAGDFEDLLKSGKTLAQDKPSLRQAA